MKTTKATQDHCLKCKHCEVVSKIAGGGTMCKCNAENKVIMNTFNSRDFYCKEYKGFNELSEFEINKYREQIQKKYSDSAFREYANKYFSKKQAREMIRKRKGK